jgi:hypothetical protein
MGITETDQPGTAEVVENFFTATTTSPYAYDFVHRQDSPEEIRRYVERVGIENLRFDNLARLYDFEDNETICEVLDQALKAWVHSSPEEEGLTTLFKTGRKYLGLITYLISIPMNKYDSSDRAATDRMTGAFHLKFLANHLNESLDDPAQRAAWDKAFMACFSHRETEESPPIASLFCRYLLESENKTPHTPFYFNKTCFNLSGPVLKFLCEKGSIAVQRNIWARRAESSRFLQLFNESADLAIALNNIVANVCRHDLCKDFSEESKHEFKNVLKLYLFNSTLPDMKDYLQQGSEDFVKLAIEAWSDLYQRREIFVSEHRIDVEQSAMREFLLGIQAWTLNACRDEWIEMQEIIRQL